MKSSKSGALVKAARMRAGLTQAQLAELADTSQSAIAAYEAGEREPTIPVLQRMVSATGHRLLIEIDSNRSLYRLTDLALDIKKVPKRDITKRMRLVFEFLRGAEEDGHSLQLLITAEPQSIGDTRFDVLLAAVGEYLAVKHDIPPPRWVQSKTRFLDGAWWISAIPSARARALVHTPASFRRRGVMIDRRDLESK